MSGPSSAIMTSLDPSTLNEGMTLNQAVEKNLSKNVIQIPITVVTEIGCVDLDPASRNFIKDAKWSSVTGGWINRGKVIKNRDITFHI
jgi:predicted oxidoreductase